MEKRTLLQQQYLTDATIPFILSTINKNQPESQLKKQAEDSRIWDSLQESCLHSSKMSVS